MMSWKKPAVSSINQPPEAVLGIKVFSGVIPGAACFLGALLLVWYPLRGAYLAQVQARVLELHQEKKAVLEQRLAGEGV